MSKKIKIGIVTDQLLAGGVQLAGIEQVKELNRLGHKAKLLILMRKKYPTDFSYLVRDVPHEYLSDYYPLLFRKTVKFPIFSFLSTLHLMSPILAPRVLKRGDYDVLVSLGTTTSLTTQAIYRKLHIPYIAVIHDPIEYILEKAYSKTNLKYSFPVLKALGRFFEKSFVKDAKQTLIISNVHLDYLKKNYGIEPKVLMFGAKTLNRIPPKRGNTLLSFGRWQKEKNPEFLLRLIKQIPKARLVIAGSWIENEELKQFRKKIEKDNLKKLVSLIPHYEKNELSKLCHDARLFLHPHFEAFGLAALEAASHGLPIVMPEKSGVTEQFTHGIHGFFPKNVTIDEYKKYILQLLSNERLAFRMGLSAWKQVNEKYSWGKNVNDLLHLVNQILESEGKPRIMVLEISHALGAPLAGGDKLMEPMATRLEGKFAFSIIVSSVGAEHWRKAPLKKEMLTLPRTKFDESGKPADVFLAYCLRMWQAYKILLEKVDESGLRNILYSSTNILPDVLPAYFAKMKKRQAIWIARVHHLIPPPHKREGRLIVNIVSFLMQALALFMIKSKADIVIVLNEQLKKDLEEKGFLKEKLRVLGGGIEFERIQNTKITRKRKFNAVFLGRLHVTKGVFDTILIWKEVVKKLPNAKLAIIGDGPIEIKKTLAKEIRNANLSKNVELVGFLPYPQVFAIMKQADIFLFLDHEAGWGLAVAEAMACGLPVVGYDTGVLGDVYKEGFRKVALRKYSRLANEVIKLLTNKYLRQKLSREAIEEASLHDWKETSKRLDLLLDKIISSPQGKRP